MDKIKTVTIMCIVIILGLGGLAYLILKGNKKDVKEVEVKAAEIPEVTD